MHGINGLSIGVLFLVLSRECVAQGEFSPFGYPVNSQPCVNQAFKDSSCPKYAATQQDVNRCPCSNKGKFVGNTAKCVYKSDYPDIAQVWNEMFGACALSGLTLDYSESRFLNGGQDVASSSTSGSRFGASSTVVGSNSGPIHSTPATNSDTGMGSSSSNDDSGNDVGGLSGGLIALISCMASVGCLIVAVVMCCCPCGGHNRVERWSKEHWRQYRGQPGGYPVHPTYPETRVPWMNSGYD